MMEDEEKGASVLCRVQSRMEVIEYLRVLKSAGYIQPNTENIVSIHASNGFSSVGVFDAKLADRSNDGLPK